jgi:hypothetical protein
VREAVRRRLLAGVAGAVVVGAAVAGPAGVAPAGAAAPAEVAAVGWWSRRPGATAQPPGGFEVAAGLDGPESVAAVRVAVGAPLARVVLVLGEREGLFQERAALRVCPAADGWAPANPGPFDAAPAAACDRHAALSRNAAQANWTADVTALLPADGTASLAVVPVRADGLALDPGFQVRFASASLLVEVAAGGEAGGGAGGEVGREPFGGAAAPVGGAAVGDGAGAPVGLGALGDLGPVPTPGPGGVVPAAPGAPTAPGSPGAPGVAGATEAGAAEGTAGPRPLAGPALVRGTGRSRPWWRLALVLPASALVGLATAAARRRLLVSPFWRQERA